MKNRTPKLLRMLMTAALCAAAGLIALYSVYMLWERPPEKAAAPLAAKAPPLPAEAGERAETRTPAPSAGPKIITVFPGDQ